jgi:hypothetical protein
VIGQGLPRVGRTTAKPPNLPKSFQIFQIAPDRRLARPQSVRKLLMRRKPFLFKDLQNFRTSLIQQHSVRPGNLG